MTSWQMTRIIAGALTLISLALAVKVNINWLWFNAFIGVNLLQSGFTRWCLMEQIMRRLGLRAGD
jgi:hypothetical protein